MTKHISLRQLDPIALLKLREEGECFVSIPETLFDLDYPGHYMRRIKSINLSIPCVVGPYTSVSCTLTLTQSKVRRNSTTAENYADEANYTIDFISTQSIATSRAQSDSGLFELNFRDERYLPFEYAGVISEWKVELPKEFRQFDYNTITDVIIHMNYTGRDGGNSLKSKAIANLQQEFKHSQDTEQPVEEGNKLLQLFSAKHDFPNRWHQFLTQEQPSLSFDLNKDRFPFYFQAKTITIYKIDLYLKLKDGVDNSLSEVQLKYPDDKDDNQTCSFTANSFGLYCTEIAVSHIVGEPITWALEVQEGNLEAIDDMFIICHYEVL